MLKTVAPDGRPDNTLKFPGRTPVRLPAEQQILVELVERRAPTDGRHGSPWPGLSFFRTSRAWPPQPVVYKPCLCIVAQGSKRAFLGDRVYFYDSMNYLVLSVPLPVKAGVVEASPEKPFLSLVLEIDTSAVSELLLEIAEEGASPAPKTAPGIYVSRLDEGLSGAVIRLLQVLDGLPRPRAADQP